MIVGHLHLSVIAPKWRYRGPEEAPDFINGREVVPESMPMIWTFPSRIIGAIWHLPGLSAAHEPRVLRHHLPGMTPPSLCDSESTFDKSEFWKILL